jgi:hypothetical protein
MPQQPAFSGQRIFQEPLVDPKTGKMTWSWLKQFSASSAQHNAPAATIPPPVAGQKGTQGQISVDEQFAYFVTPSGTWKKIPLIDL